MHYLLILAAAVPTAEMQAVAPDYAAYVDEAGQKCGLPGALIRAVISTESAGNLRAVSPKGAMGLMQLMPTTWQDLRSRFGLGDNPFDPHDNIIAGACYLRALYDSYGPDGFLAAYNAGPGRWENHRDTGRPLPMETRAYVAAITQKLDPAALRVTPGSLQSARPTWMEAALFLQDSGTEDGRPTVFVAGPSPFVSVPVTTPASDREAGQ
jgi:soluble lytic murein transglycosylase-like protein